jgi:hypothetical protein
MHQVAHIAGSAIGFPVHVLEMEVLVAIPELGGFGGFLLRDVFGRMAAVAECIVAEGEGFIEVTGEHSTKHPPMITSVMIVAGAASTFSHGQVDDVAPCNLFLDLYVAIQTQARWLVDKAELVVTAVGFVAISTILLHGLVDVNPAEDPPHVRKVADSTEIASLPPQSELVRRLVGIVARSAGTFMDRPVSIATSGECLLVAQAAELPILVHAKVELSRGAMRVVAEDA